MKILLAFIVVLAVFGAVVAAVPTCDDFVANLPTEAIGALRNACANGAKAWFCDNCKDFEK